MNGRGAAGQADTRQGAAQRGDTATGTVSGVVGAGVAVAAVAVLALHALGAGVLDPVALTISDYVAVPGGAAVLGLAAAGLATAGAALARATPRAGWPRVVGPLLAGWCVALVLVAVFPTHAVDAVPDTAALVHRWAGAFVFVVPPVAGLLAAGRAPGPLRSWSVAAGVAALVFMLAHAPAVLSGAPPFPLLGAVERLAYLIMLGQVLVFGRTAGSRAAARAAARRSRPAGAGGVPVTG